MMSGTLILANQDFIEQELAHECHRWIEVYDALVDGGLRGMSQQDALGVTIDIGDRTHQAR
jgi:hypothetical protein